MFEVFAHVETAITEKNLGALYSSLAQLHANTLAVVAGTNPAQMAQLSQQIATARSALLEALSSSEPPASWTNEQHELFVQLLRPIQLGKSAAEALGRVLGENAANGPAVAQALQNTAGTIAQIQQRVANVLAGLAPVREKHARPPQPSDEAIVKLTFDGRAAVKTLDDLSTAAGEWNVLMQTFARLTRQPPESPRIADAYRGSFILELAHTPAVIGAIAATVAALFTIREKILSLKKIALELKALGNDAAERLETDAKHLEDRAATEVGEKLVKQNQWPDNGEGNEIRTLVITHVNTINVFQISGGTLEFRAPPQPSEGSVDPALQLRKTLEELVAKDAKIKELSAQIEQHRQLPETASTDPSDPAPEG